MYASGYSVFSEARGPPRVYTANDFGVPVDVPDDGTGHLWIYPMSGSMDDPFRRAGNHVGYPQTLVTWGISMKSHYGCPLIGIADPSGRSGHG